MTRFCAVIVCHGDAPSTTLLQCETEGADLVVYTDGAAPEALRRGERVDIVVGDMDSVGDGGLGVPVVDAGPHDEQENSDSEKAVLYAIKEAEKRGHTGRDSVSIRMLGAAGSRLDHSLANLLLCAAYRERAWIEIVDDRWRARVLTGNESLGLPVGTTVSLVALCGDAEIETSGLAWEIIGALELGTRGLSNRVSASPVRIDVRRGSVALIVGVT